MLPVFAAALLAMACSSNGGPAAVTPAAGANADSVASAVQTSPREVELPALPAAPERVTPPDDPVPAPEPLVDAAADLAESLAAYEASDGRWQRGDFEGAVAELDRAYELMSGVELDGDPLLAQEQEDLRRLISRRVVEIYTSRANVVGDSNGGSIPLERNSYVDREIKSFQTTERESFKAAYERSGLYRPMIVEELRRAGMPEELSWLPVVESWFKVKAFSSARALGMWQFIASTGYRFGLRRTDWYDERMDPEKSTRAAAAYLGELHGLFGDWLTALAAYNCGESRVLRVIKEQRIPYFDRFWDLYGHLPRETRRFAPRFLATLHIVDDPAAFGFTDLPRPLGRLAWDTVEVERPIRLADLDGKLGFEKGTLAALNPELRQGATPASNYALKVPPARSATVVAALADLPRYQAPVVTTSTHVVRRGETLGGIARRYRTSVGSLLSMNGLRNANRIYPGQRLRVTGSAPAVAIGPGEQVTYTVRPGDSLWRIADRHGTTVDRIRAQNGLRGNALQPGQRLTIGGGGSGGSSAGATYVVRSGDTLGKIAERNRVPLGRLVAANGLSTRSTIYPGQRLTIPR